MSGVSRFLSIRDKDGRPVAKHHHRHPHLHHRHDAGRNQPVATSEPTSSPSNASPTEFYGLFASSSSAKASEEFKLSIVRQRLLEAGIVSLKDPQLLWALRCEMVRGDTNGAFDLIVAMVNSIEGLITAYDPTVRMQGAVNRAGISCYLDSTLFAMFARLDTFETMLYNAFDDTQLNKLGFLIRLWVNLLRSGKLITTDITKVIQNTISKCGWREGGLIAQQDASEAFTFITGALQLPLLTLKIDIYHTGKEDEKDDHKYVNERLLEVAVPTPPLDGKLEVTLEECLEEYFNNRIEVRRYLERRSTMTSANGDKAKSVHVEAVEVDPDSGPSTPLSQSPSHAPSPLATFPRNRSESIIQERFVPDPPQEGKPVRPVDLRTKGRSGSMRKEVMMPAWQFYSLIPWYAEQAPSNDAQVAQHLSTKRPVLGLCLKRYTFTPSGKAIRLNTYIDIPTEIKLPRFIQDARGEEDGVQMGNFKLSLQSVVCHRGRSVNSGHYISLVRGAAPNKPSDDKSWLKFDDLSSPRITTIDIERALKEECAYLLFYQIMPVESDAQSAGGLETVNEMANGTLSESETDRMANGTGDNSSLAGSTLSLVATNSEPALSLVSSNTDGPPIRLITSNSDKKPTHTQTIPPISRNSSINSATSPSATSPSGISPSAFRGLGMSRKSTNNEGYFNPTPRTSLDITRDERRFRNSSVDINDDTRGRGSIDGRRGSIISFVEGTFGSKKTPSDLALAEKQRPSSPSGKPDSLSRTLSRGSSGFGRAIGAISGRRKSLADVMMLPMTEESTDQIKPPVLTTAGITAEPAGVTDQHGVTVAATPVSVEGSQTSLPLPSFQSSVQQHSNSHHHPHLHPPHMPHRTPSKLERARHKSSKSIGKIKDPDRECLVM